MLVECWKNTYRGEEVGDFLTLKLSNDVASSELQELVASRLKEPLGGSGGGFKHHPCKVRPSQIS